MRTQGEWKYKKVIKGFDESIGYLVGTDDSGTIADILKGFKGECKANARFICKAVNSYDKLVEALEGLLKHADEDEYSRPNQYKWIKKAQQALKQVDN